MKKRVLLILVLSFIVAGLPSMPVSAGMFANHKAAVAQAKYEKDCKKEIQELFNKQDKYAAKYDIEALKTLYSKNFIDGDGYNKDVYFDLVKDTWETYPDITYTTKITDIQLNGDYATVETVESAVATTDDVNKALFGELHSSSKCTYHLQRFSSKWEITGEIVTEETSTLKFGDARYVKMSLESPKMVAAGQDYTATLKVDLPSDNIVVASINQEKIIHPQKKSPEAYMKLNDTQTLARIFKANTDNINEYNVASVGITASEVKPGMRPRVYMNGLAYVMTRVNVVPKNNFAKVTGTDGDKSNEQQAK